MLTLQVHPLRHHGRDRRVCALVIALLLCGSRADAGAGAATAPAGGDPLPPTPLPQYIFFNRAPGAAAGRWHPGHPERFTPEGLLEIVQALGTRGTDGLRVGASFMFSILEYDPQTTGEGLRRLLAAAEQADVPVLIGLDGQNWWEHRGDLWNWWDPSLPGYDPQNRHHVEWTGWGPEHAVKIGWRNWGRQMRVRPAPNIASPRFLDAHWKAYDTLIPIVREWYERLPADRKYLLGGVKVGWEASINVNAFYYTGGNALFEQSPRDASRDPQQRDRSAGWTFGQTPLGYAAAWTSGVKRHGTLEKEDIEQVVHRYLEQLARGVYERGFPRHLIFTHQGGTYAPWEKHLSFRPAINSWSIPGWSFYSHDPTACGSLGTDLAAAGREQWAASEWWRGSNTVEGWRDRFLAALRFRQCRFVCVFNWESFVRDVRGLEAVRRLAKPDSTGTRPGG